MTRVNQLSTSRYRATNTFLINYLLYEWLFGHNSRAVYAPIKQKVDIVADKSMTA